LRFRKVIAVVAAGLACSAGSLAATAPKPKTKKSVHSKTTAHAVRTVHQTPARPAPAKWRPGQTAPTPDRYKEIQEALAKKGYLHGEASGVWNEDSSDALRRFQQDQNLQASGKLDSLSIIALGLGPKY
jgi:peptidoglycan hydrolase-like protein with peptidoglycan-binding domain